MKENVGKIDRIARFIIGPSVAAIGYGRLGGCVGAVPGLTAMIMGALLVESAITRVCPVNGLLGIDTRTQRERTRDLAAPTQRRGLLARKRKLVTPEGSYVAAPA